MSSTYTSNPTATQAPGPQPGPGVLPAISLPSDGDPDSAATFSQALKEPIDWCGYLNQQAIAAIFGDGADGAATLDGTNTVSWAAKSGSTYTMTRDARLASLTVTGPSVVLVTSGYRLLVKGTLATVGGASINNDGGAASGSTAGTGALAGSLLGGANGGAGGNPTGSNGTSSTNSGGGAGGNAGTGGTPGTGGTATAPTASLGNIGSLCPFIPGFVVGISAGSAVWTAVSGGAGGGGGGNGSGGIFGGGGGGGAGVMDVRARVLNLATAGDIHCNGGKGGDAQVGGTAGGGGGGGGGGFLCLAYGSAILGSGSFSAATNCAGGAGGALYGTGTAGSPGSNGVLVNLLAS